MYKPKLGDYLLWRGKLAKVFGLCDQPTVMFEIIEPNKCPHCQGLLENERVDVVIGCPNWDEGAKPIHTITK